jgi:antitoxin HigA-1
VTPTELARQLKVPGNRITQIIQGKRAISGDTALRLGHWFGTSAQFWLNLQSAYDIRMAARQAGAHIARLPMRSSREQGQRRDGEAAVDRGDDNCYDHRCSCADSADAVS